MEKGDKKTIILASETIKNNMEQQIAASLTSQADSNTISELNNRNDADLCPVHDTDLTDGFCEFCQVCYTCK